MRQGQWRCPERCRIGGCVFYLHPACLAIRVGEELPSWYCTDKRKRARFSCRMAIDMEVCNSSYKSGVDQLLNTNSAWQRFYAPIRPCATWLSSVLKETQYKQSQHRKKESRPEPSGAMSLAQLQAARYTWKEYTHTVIILTLSHIHITLDYLLKLSTWQAGNRRRWPHPHSRTEICGPSSTN